MKINNIKTGITSTTPYNIPSNNDTELNKKAKELLQPLIQDEEVLNIMLQEHNQEKIKHRYEHRLEIQDENGETLATTNTFLKTIKQLNTEITNIKNTNNNIIEYEHTGILATLDENGHNTNLIKKGTYKTIKVTSILRQK